MTDKNDYKISLEPLKFPCRGNSETDQLDIPYGYRIVTDEECWFYSVIIINAPYTQMGDAGDEEFLSRHSTREEAEAAAEWCNDYYHCEDEQRSEMHQWARDWLDAFLQAGVIKPAQEEQKTEQPTLRDQFAMAALPAVFITPNLDKERIGQHCYELADDLIAARKAEGSK